MELPDMHIEGNSSCCSALVIDLIGSGKRLQCGKCFEDCTVEGDK